MIRTQSLPDFPMKHTLSEQCIDYFLVDVHKQSTIQLNEAIAILTPSEDSRRKAFKNEKLRNRYAIRTAMFRILLANQIGCDIKDLVINQNKYGKPFIADRSLHFNVSYSDDLAIYAFSNRDELGVDIEKLVPFPDETETAKHVMTSDEYSRYRCLDGELATQFFYQIWTAKESYLKLLGVGLNIEPKQVLLKFSGKDIRSAKANQYPNAQIVPLHGFHTLNYHACLATLYRA